MIDARFGVHVSDRWGQQIALRGMQIAAGGVDAQRPTAALVFLPCRDRERQLKEGAQRFEGDRLGGQIITLIKRVVAGCLLLC